MWLLRHIGGDRMEITREGILRGRPFQRSIRRPAVAARVLRICAGTNEIMKLLIARSL